MDYESLYREYQYIEKNLKDQIKGLAKLQKSIAKGMESGELAKSRSDLSQLQSINETTRESIDGLKGVLLGFDSREYIESGLFASQLLQQCREAGIDVIGDKLVEVNVTSPTCLREMQRYYTENLAERVIIAAEEEIRTSQENNARN